MLKFYNGNSDFVSCRHYKTREQRGHAFELIIQVVILEGGIFCRIFGTTHGIFVQKHLVTLLILKHECPGGGTT